jgi:hypothetical protein
MKRGPEGDTDRAKIYRRFLELLKKHVGEMDEFLSEVRDLVPSEHFSHLKLMTGVVIADGHMPVQEEICQKYPVLKRDWMK